MKDSEPKLHVCLDRKSSTVFFASMTFRKGLQAEMRSSTDIEKGQSFLMIPVPEGWDGETITSKQITDSQQVMEANVNRTEGRGVFQVRILSGDAQVVVDQVRSGLTSDDNLRISIVDAGMVSTAVLTGNLGVKSVSTIQRTLRELPENRRLVLLDFRSVAVMSKSGIAMLYTIIKELAEHGFVMKSLVESQSTADEKLSESRISEITDIFHDRDHAVAALLSEMLD